ncbi:MAG: hypothetical protein E6Q62_10625 [Nitrosomonas sp.]|nr:MAG: hypothetical protein E6Q62_10625 [Nitrosomonas sp.]
MALTDYILTLKLNKGTQQALLANIEAALHANDQKAAQQQLIALSNKIHAMSGKKFSANIEEALQTMLKGIYLTL